MPQALITINAVAGSNPPNGTALPINVLVGLDNTNSGGELTYLWEFLDRPEGSAAALSNPAIQAPTFTPDVEGTYLIKLTVNRTLPSEAVDTVIAAIGQLRTLERIPAAGETREESTSRGWALAVNRLFRLVDVIRGDGSMLIGVADGAMSRGHILRVSDVSTIKAGLPGEEVLPLFSIALATSADDAADALYLMEYVPATGTTAALGDLVRARISGLHGPYPSGSAPASGDPVYLGDTGVPALAPGANSRRIGTIAALDGAAWYFHFDGTSGAAERAELEPLVFASAPTGSYPNSVNLTALTSHLDIEAAADVANLRLARFSAAQAAPMFLLRTEIGTEIFGIRADGRVSMYDPDLVGSTINAANTFQLNADDDIILNSDGSGDFRIQFLGVDHWIIDGTTGAMVSSGGNRAIQNVVDPTSPQDVATRNYVLANSYTRVTFGSSKINAADTENYLDPGYGTRAAPTTAGGAFPTNLATRAGVIRNLRVFCRTGPTGANIVIEIIVNGSATGVTVTIVAGTTNVSLSDTTHTANITAGQTFFVRAKTAGVTATDTDDVTASFEIAAQ